MISILPPSDHKEPETLYIHQLMNRLERGLSTSELFVLCGVYVLYVHQKGVSKIHQVLEFVKPGAFFGKWASSRVYACVD